MSHADWGHRHGALALGKVVEAGGAGPIGRRNGPVQEVLRDEPGVDASIRNIVGLPRSSTNKKKGGGERATAAAMYLGDISTVVYPSPLSLETVSIRREYVPWYAQETRYKKKKQGLFCLENRRALTWGGLM